MFRYLGIVLISLCVIIGFASTTFAGQANKEFTNSVGMKMVSIEAGEFMMGFEGKDLEDKVFWFPQKKELQVREFLRQGTVDEKPAHKVTIMKDFYMGAYEVTNAQYEQFDPSHKKFRGKQGFSKGDDDAVIMVTWADAAVFCKWLSKKEGKSYRLPTEAEWEYACRAGSKTAYYTGTTLYSNDIPANAWGLYNMHGGVDEWCWDWYGPYEAADQADPVGRIDGDYKITRGGSDQLKHFYLRSANRGGSFADDKSWLLGFRVALGEMPKTEPLPKVKEDYQKNVSQKVPEDIENVPDSAYFKIRTYINIPKGATGPLHYYHNHNPDIAQCPNGDLLAIFFSTQSEGDREMVYGCSRLRWGNDKWDDSCVYWGPPDRKAEYSALWMDKQKSRVYNFSSIGVSDSRPGAVVMRYSDDNGVSWSKAKTIVERADEQGVMENVIRTSKDAIVIPADDHNLFVSNDEGKSWFSPCNAKGPAGIHTPLIELNNGDLMTFGRYDDIDGMMPKSVSRDIGKTWEVSKSEFSGIGGGKRATLLRLKEGPIVFSSFAKEMKMIDGAGRENVCDGLYAAVSYDEGKTWPLKRLISDGSGREVFTRKNKYYKMTETKSEGNGYLASCQSADGVIHIVSNRSEYALNLKWLER